MKLLDHYPVFDGHDAYVLLDGGETVVLHFTTKPKDVESAVKEIVARMPPPPLPPKISAQEADAFREAVLALGECGTKAAMNAALMEIQAKIRQIKYVEDLLKEVPK